MSDPSTTTFVARISGDRRLLSAIATMYGEALADYPDPHARDWREQVRALIHWYGRAVVIEALMEALPDLSMRRAVIVADLAERPASDIIPGD